VNREDLRMRRSHEKVQPNLEASTRTPRVQIINEGGLKNLLLEANFPGMKSSELMGDMANFAKIHTQ